MVGGRAFQQRMVSMGIRVGTELEVLRGSSGPVLVGVGESRLALGRGMAEKIMVNVDTE